MKPARRVRSKSPFASRRGRSRSPLPHRRQRSRSPFLPRLRKLDTENENGEVREPEFSVFQQLCLMDKQDDTSAIEIFLDDIQDLPDLTMTSSCSTDVSHGAFPSSESKQTSSSWERKKPFLNRLFRSPSASPADRSRGEKHPTFPEKSVDGSETDKDYIAKPPPNLSNMRSRGGLEVPHKISQRILSERFDSTSHISSLSGTRDITLDTPLQLSRHESLGNDSIKDIRKALKEMEKQLNYASNKGKRISRQKVMRALFIVADSLDDLDERQILKEELADLMKKEETSNRALDFASSDDEKSVSTTSDEEELTQSSSTIFQEEDESPTQEDMSPFNLLSSVGRFFSISSDEKNAVEQALDDLLWTEFVTSRQACAATKDRSQALDCSSESEASWSKKYESETLSSASGENSGIRSSPKYVYLKPPQETNKPQHGNQEFETVTQARPFSRSIPLARSPGRRERSWWRGRQSSLNSITRSSQASRDLQDHNDFAYLPESIRVKSRDKLSHRFVAPQQPYHMKLIDSESRYGYEIRQTKPHQDPKKLQRR